jgi:hypothetical protein
MDPETQAPNPASDGAAPETAVPETDVPGTGTPQAEASDTDGDRKAAPPAPTTTSIDHPDLGPATAFLDDRARTRRNLLIAFASVGVGLLGVAMGIGDAQGGDQIGLLFGVGGLVLLVYGINEIRLGAARMLRPIRLIVGERGFDFPTAPGPIAWDEVAALAFEVQPREAEPTALRAQVRAPDEFAQRHSMTNQARLRLSNRDGWIGIGGGLAMPLDAVLGMMKEHLARSRGANPHQDRPGTGARSKRVGRSSRH